MADPRQLARLLREVKGVASPVQRMKVLARAWRTLQRLSPTERASLASEVGIDGAEEIVERMASKYGRLKPAVILQALEKARGVQPGQLKDLFSGLRDPRRRKEILRHGLEVLGRELADEAAPVPLSTPPSPTAGVPQYTVVPETAAPAKLEPESRKTAASGTATIAAAAVTGAAAAAAAKAKSAPPPAPPQRKKPKPKPKPKPRPEPPKVHRLGPTPEPPRRTPPPPATRRVERPALVEARAGRPVKPPDRAQRLKHLERLEQLTAGDLIERVENAGNLIRSLRVLRTHAGRARGLSVEELRRLLDLFESPWSRRRALTALLEHRAPASVPDALTLIDELASPAARRWCVGTILHKWELSDTVREDLVERRGRPGRRASTASA